MAAKQKPQEDLVKLAGRAMTHPEELTGSDIKRLAARILDDQKNDPAAHAPSLASQVIAKVGDLLPDVVKPKAAAKTAAKAPPPPKDPAKPAPAAKKATLAAKSAPPAPPAPEPAKPEPAKASPAKAPAAKKAPSKSKAKPAPAK